MKNDKGITLITLVITIILLIIFASISINLSIGQNTLFSRGKYARNTYLNAQENEKQGINDLYSEMMIATNDSSQITISTQDLKKLINEQVKNEVSQALQNNIMDYSNNDNIITDSKTLTIGANSWAYNILGPTIGNGTWLIFIDAYCNSSSWLVSGIYGTACPHSYVDKSHKGAISTSGYYNGTSTTLTAGIFSGSNSTEQYTITFKALKLSNTY